MKKKPKKDFLREKNLLKESLGQITQAAYQVALKTGFRGSFVYFLEEIQEALSSVMRQDQKRNSLRPIGKSM